MSKKQDNLGDDFDPSQMIREVASSIFRNSVAVHQRKCSNRHNVRSPSDIRCNCAEHWDSVRQWCSNCGRTKEEIRNRS